MNGLVLPHIQRNVAGRASANSTAEVVVVLCVFCVCFLGRNELSYPEAKNERIILTSNTDVHLTDF